MSRHPLSVEPNGTNVRCTRCHAPWARMATPDEAATLARRMNTFEFTEIPPAARVRSGLCHPIEEVKIVPCKDKPYPAPPRKPPWVVISLGALALTWTIWSAPGRFVATVIRWVKFSASTVAAVVGLVVLAAVWPGFGAAAVSVLQALVVTFGVLLVVTIAGAAAYAWTRLPSAPEVAAEVEPAEAER